MTQHFDVVVVGAGLVGAAAALAISQLGLRVAVVEPKAPQRSVGDLGIDIRNVALSPSSRSLLAGLEAWAEGAPYTRMWVCEERGTSHLDFRADEVGADQLGWIVESSALALRLWQQLEQCPEVTLFPGYSVAELSPSGEGVTLVGAKGQSQALAADLLVASDGGRSAVRDLVGVAVERFQTGQQALATVVETERPHAACAYQRFLLDGPLALLPSTEPHLVSVVWSQSEASAQTRMGLSDADFCAALSAASNRWLGEVRRCDRRFAFPLAQHCVASFNPLPRVLLIGDAARTVHPLAGLGVNLGFEDVAALVATLQSAGGPQGFDGSGFARRRKARAMSMVRLLAALQKTFAEPHPLAGWLRNVGVSLVNSQGALKRQIIREALGVGAESASGELEATEATG